MAMANLHSKNHQPTRSQSEFDYVNLAVALIAVAAITVIFIGVAQGQTPPWLLIPPALLGAWSVIAARPRR